MAQMWPRKLPREIIGHPYRKAEVEVYRKLEKELDDTYVVFYSRPWLGLTSGGEEIDGECDFLVCSAARGMLSIEVKGGGIDYDPASEAWYSTNRNGVKSKIKDPVKQARESKHKLLKELKESGRFPDRYVRARHGVIFPDCEEVTTRMLGVGRPAGMFCNEVRFERDLAGWIVERLSGKALINEEDEESGVGLGVDGVKAFEDILAAPIHLKIPLRRRIKEDHETLEVLTQQQLRVLRGLTAKRVGISGPAGTGKTVLAMEEAAQCAAKDRRTALLCYNQGLAGELRRRMGSRENLFIGTFHEYCGKVTASAHVKVQAEGRDLYGEALPEALINAFDAKPDLKVDALVIDEGQDFMPLWWTALDAGLNADGRIRVFFDRNQLVYTGRELPADIPCGFKLTQVLRNTQRIFAAAQDLYEKERDVVIEATGPEGEPVRFIPAGTSGLAKSAVDVVKEMVGVEKADPSDIAVLFPRESDCGSFESAVKLPWQRCGQDGESLVVDTIRRFKGLERPIVVVALDEGLLEEIELRYVALTRPSTLLVVIAHEVVLKQLAKT